MRKGRIGRAPAWLLALATAGVLLPGRVEAKGTYFLVELSSGLGESPYEAGPLGLNLGLSAGTTFKLAALPIRFQLLGTALSRSGMAATMHRGIPVSVERRDLDVFFAERTVVPVWRSLRLFVEAGAGHRFSTYSIHRGWDLDPLSADGSELLLVVAAGAQARLTRTISVGLRAELLPLPESFDLATYAAGLAPTRNRASLMALLGFHF